MTWPSLLRACAWPGIHRFALTVRSLTHISRIAKAAIISLLYLWDQLITNEYVHTFILVGDDLNGPKDVSASSVHSFIIPLPNKFLSLSLLYVMLGEE